MFDLNLGQQIKDNTRGNHSGHKFFGAMITETQVPAVSLDDFWIVDFRKIK